MQVLQKSLSLREQKRELSRRAIVEAARALLDQKGYAEMSMDDVATRVGISKATLYQHFRSKDELSVAAIARDIERIAELIASLDRTLPAIERLELVLREGLKYRYAYSAQLPAMLPSAVWDHPDFRAQRKRTFAAANQLMKEAQAEGAIRADVPLPVLNALISGMFSINAPELMRSVNQSFETTCDMLLRTLFDGIRAPAPTRTRSAKRPIKARTK